MVEFSLFISMLLVFAMLCKGSLVMIGVCFLSNMLYILVLVYISKIIVRFQFWNRLANIALSYLHNSFSYFSQFR